MPKKGITIDDLAVVIQKGFGTTSKKTGVDKRFDEIDKRLGRIENVILIDHSRRIEKLEKQVNELKDALAL